MVKCNVITKWDEFKQKWLATRMGSRLQNVWSYVGWDDYFAFFILAVGGLGYLTEWGEFYMDIRSELIGIGLSVLLIANAGEAILSGQEKKQLILQMGSPDKALIQRRRGLYWLNSNQI